MRTFPRLGSLALALPLIALLACAGTPSGDSRGAPATSQPGAAAPAGAGPVHTLAVDPQQLSGMAAEQKQEVARQALQALGLHRQLLEQRQATARVANDTQLAGCLGDKLTAVGAFGRVGERALQEHTTRAAAGDAVGADHELSKLLVALSKADEMQRQAERCSPGAPAAVAPAAPVPGAGQTTVEVEVIAP